MSDSRSQAYTDNNAKACSENLHSGSVNGMSTPAEKLQLHSEIPTNLPHTPLLDGIASPDDVQPLNIIQLQQLAHELRSFLLYHVGKTGGHFAGNLGVVELTIALHHVYQAPDDKIIWDVGHQAYAHKVLTGRKDKLHSIRQFDGLHAFPHRDESDYDCFGVGHSSTSISAALGMAAAIQVQTGVNDTHNGTNKQVVCVIGDGALSAGMAYEAINDAVHQNVPLTIVLNDNDMSISHSIGGLTKHLKTIKQNHKDALTLNLADVSTPKQPNIFTDLGCEYIGVVNGHDISDLVHALQQAQTNSRVTVVHVQTVKGKGLSSAEHDPIGFHAITGSNNTPTGNKQAQTPKKKYSQVFGEFLCNKASIDKRLVAITPAMCEGSGMVDFAQQYPQRFYDVAIAEQHSVTLAAGLACEGLKPIVAIYSTFLQRAYDQLIHDVALQELDVTFGIDRAGLVGEDGSTHAGLYDYAYMRCLPDVVIMAASNENECYAMLNTAYEYKGVASVRYPRGTGTGATVIHTNECIPIGTSELVHEHIAVNPVQKFVMLAFGTMVQTSINVAEKLISERSDISISVVNMRFIKPLDTKTIIQYLLDGYQIITTEEHMKMGGAGSAVNEFVMSYAASHMITIPAILNIGIDDLHIPQGTREQQLSIAKLDVQGVYKQMIKICKTAV